MSVDDDLSRSYQNVWHDNALISLAIIIRPLFLKSIVIEILDHYNRRGSYSITYILKRQCILFLVKKETHHFYIYIEYTFLLVTFFLISLLGLERSLAAEKNRYFFCVTKQMAQSSKIKFYCLFYLAESTFLYFFSLLSFQELFISFVFFFVLVIAGFFYMVFAISISNSNSFDIKAEV